MRTLQDCIAFANENQVCYLATVEGDEPRVRAMGFWFADQTGFYFQTATVKEIPAQLEKNPNIEACFYKHAGMLGEMMRVGGAAEFVADPAMKIRVLEERPFLRLLGLTEDSPELVIFRIAHGRAHFWTMADNLKAKEYILF